MENSTYQVDYKCPCPRRLFTKTARPPMGTQSVPPPVLRDHKLPQKLAEKTKKMTKRYDELKSAQHKLCKALGVVRHEMRDIDNRLMDVASAMEKATDGRAAPMKSVYQTDYSKKQFPVVDYTKTMTAADPGIWTDPRKTVPVEKLQIGGLQGYKDPCNFRYNALNTVDVGSPSPLTFDRIPINIQQYFYPQMGRSEYQDSISLKGKEIVDQLEAWREPQPSSRRRCF